MKRQSFTNCNRVLSCNRHLPQLWKRKARNQLKKNSRQLSLSLSERAHDLSSNRTGTKLVKHTTWHCMCLITHRDDLNCPTNQNSCFPMPIAVETAKPTPKPGKHKPSCTWQQIHGETTQDLACWPLLNPTVSRDWPECKVMPRTWDVPFFTWRIAQKAHVHWPMKGASFLQGCTSGVIVCLLWQHELGLRESCGCGSLETQVADCIHMASPTWNL